MACRRRWERTVCSLGSCAASSCCNERASSQVCVATSCWRERCCFGAVSMRSGRAAACLGRARWHPRSSRSPFSSFGRERAAKRGPAAQRKPSNSRGGKQQQEAAFAGPDELSIQAPRTQNAPFSRCDLRLVHTARMCDGLTARGGAVRSPLHSLAATGRRSRGDVYCPRRDEPCCSGRLASM